ncbi:MAG: hypothetical protein JW740_01530 [Candidatus Zambryskibacteria bacterium]|nr:hypothetical protein [Candidatus Zambryskibacteria bacterium]
MRKGKPYAGFFYFLICRYLNHKIIIYNPNAMKKSLILAPVFGVLLLGVLLFLNGCRIFKSVELRELEDLVSVIQLTTGKEISRSVRDKGTELGRSPIYAEIYLKYRPINDYTKNEVYQEIIEILERRGWKADDWNIVPDFFSASLKSKDNVHTITAGVRLHSDANLVSVRVTHSG